jgi:hypothetical protein
MADSRTRKALLAQNEDRSRTRALVAQRTNGNVGKWGADSLATIQGSTNGYLYESERVPLSSRPSTNSFSDVLEVVRGRLRCPAARRAMHDMPRSVLSALEASRRDVASTRGRVVRRERAGCLHGCW